MCLASSWKVGKSDKILNPNPNPNPNPDRTTHEYNASYVLTNEISTEKRKLNINLTLAYATQ